MQIVSSLFTIGNPASTYDQISGAGTLTLNSMLNVTVTGFDGGYIPVDSDMWTLLDWVTIAPNGFDAGTNFRTGGNGGGTLSLPDVSGFNLLWDITAFNSNGRVSVVAIPEPTRALLMFFGLAALFLRRRRSR